MPIIWFIKKAFWCLFKAFLDFAYSIQICSVQKVGYWVVELWRYLLNYSFNWQFRPTFGQNWQFRPTFGQNWQFRPTFGQNFPRENSVVRPSCRSQWQQCKEWGKTLLLTSWLSRNKIKWLLHYDCPTFVFWYL